MNRMKQLRELPPALTPLTKLHHWVVWRKTLRDGKATKPPYRVDNPKQYAASNNPRTWASYEAAVQAAAADGVDGIGFVITGACIEDKAVVVVDFDHCVHEDGSISKWAKELLAQAPGAYTEISPSGGGVHVIGLSKNKARLDTKVSIEGGGSYEVYRSTERYITISGAQMDVTGKPNGACRELTLIDELIDALAQPKPSADDGVKLDTSKAFAAAVWRLAGRGMDVDEIVAEFLAHPKKYSLTKAAEYHARGEGKLREFVESSYCSWQQSQPADLLKVTWENGKLPKKSVADACAALQYLDVRCSYDEFHDALLIDGDVLGRWRGNVSDHTTHVLRHLLRRKFGFDPGQQHTSDAIVQLCLDHTFNPVLDYLNGLQWDGKPRLDTWVVDYMGVPNTRLHRAIGRLSLIAAVRRVRAPGTKFDQIVVLEGPEGINKSKSIELLAGKENFSDQTILGMNDRQQQEALRGRWLYEIADLTGITNIHVNAMKAFASRTTDRARPAYGHFLEDRRRTCVLFASTNDDLYMRGGNGNRRLWPLPTMQIDIEALKRDRDQLWAEAAAEEAAGASIVLAGELWPVAEIEQEKRRIRDAWEDILSEVIGIKTPDGEEERVSSKELFEDYLELKARDLRQFDTKRLADCMRKLGWEVGKMRVHRGGPVVAGYRRPVVTTSKRPVTSKRTRNPASGKPRPQRGEDE